MEHAVGSGYVNNHRIAKHGGFKGGGIVCKFSLLLGEQRVVKGTGVRIGRVGDVGVDPAAQTGNQRGGAGTFGDHFLGETAAFQREQHHGVEIFAGEGGIVGGNGLLEARFYAVPRGGNLGFLRGGERDAELLGLLLQKNLVDERLEHTGRLLGQLPVDLVGGKRGGHCAVHGLNVDHLRGKLTI